jgi:hypothetical protein
MSMFSAELGQGPWNKGVRGSLTQRALAVRAGISYTALKERMRRHGLTAAQAAAYVPGSKVQRRGGICTSNGGKQALTPEQFFINALCDCLDLEPIYAGEF